MTSIEARFQTKIIFIQATLPKMAFSHYGIYQFSLTGLTKYFHFHFHF